MPVFKKLPFPKREDTAQSAAPQAGAKGLKAAFKKAASRHAPWYVKALRCALLVSVCYPAFQAGTMMLPGRHETAGERAMLSPIFKDAIDYNKVRIHSSAVMDRLVNPFGGEMSGVVTEAHTRGDVIVMTRAENSPDFSKLSADDERRMAFIHENVHIWQFQNRPVAMMLGILSTMADRVRGVEETYDYTLKPGRDLADYSIEQQATIITDYYMDVSKGKPPIFSDNAEKGAALKALYDGTLKNFKTNPRYIATYRR